MRYLPLLLIFASCSESSRDSAGTPIEACLITASGAWANNVALPDDPFVHGPDGGELNRPLPSWVKFAVLECDPSTVYFQDSRSYPFHYDFATSELDPFLGMSRSEFDSVTLYEGERAAILGAVMIQPFRQLRAGAEEYGIQLVGIDALEKERVVDIVRQVSARIGASQESRIFYFPVFEQQATAIEHRDFYASQGIEISSAERWSSGNFVYATGWAIGQLKFFPAEELEEAFERGDLGPGDVLLTDGIPASVPLVAGILTLSASSAASHTAILSKTFGVPFGYLANEDDRLRARELIGRRVAVRAYETFGGHVLDVIDVENEVDDVTLAEILKLKRPQPLELEPVAPLGEIARSVRDVALEDTGFVGGKAAGLGTLTRSIPDNVPAALAFTFDLWSGFLDRPGAVGTASTSLRDLIQDRLSGYTFPPVDMAVLAADLEAVRDWIKDPALTSFAEGHEAAVIEALLDPAHGLQPDAKIRFRSSSNMEDAQRFTGAGLYSSFSGCLNDELDEDELGPSHCDPEKSSERGVFRAIRKVFASFYDERPFLARLQYEVAERDVGMAVLAHHSFPDEFELANGVVTLEQPDGRTRHFGIATQAGAVSVTNPEPGQVPERMEGVRFGGLSLYLDLIEPSNLIPIGARVMDWTADYFALVRLVEEAAEQFELETGRRSFALEFEFKKLAPGGAAMPSGGLVVKQLREVPLADTQESIVPYVIGSTASQTTFQGERSNVISNHRLKVELELTTRGGWLDELIAAEELFEAASLRFTDGCSIQEEDFVIPNSSKAFQVWDGEAFVLTLDQPMLANPRVTRIRTMAIPTLVAPSAAPILIAKDLRGFVMDVDHLDPVSVWQDFPAPGLVPVYQEQVTLTGPRTSLSTDLPHDFRAEDNGVVIEVEMRWPRGPGASAGYTAPLVRWDQTVITGLTQDPIVLEGEFSQTYRPEHHNFSERFVFAPHLEPGLAGPILEELEARGIHLIFLSVSFGHSIEATITTYNAADIGDPCVLGK